MIYLSVPSSPAFTFTPFSTSYSPAPSSPAAMNDDESTENATLLEQAKVLGGDQTDNFIPQSLQDAPDFARILFNEWSTTSGDHVDRQYASTSTGAGPSRKVQPAGTCEDTLEETASTSTKEIEGQLATKMKKASAGPGAKSLKRKGSSSQTNRKPCAHCQRLQKKCEVVCEKPRLCERCKTKGQQQCPPHISKKEPTGKKSKAEYTELEPSSGLGVLKFM